VDSRTRALWRGLTADGTLVNVITDIIKNLDPASQESKEITRYLKFYADRLNYKWRLAIHDEDGYKGGQFSIAHLGDDTIRRLINETPCKRVQKYWIERGQDQTSGGWRDDQWSYNRRSAYVVVLEEAEYRRILTEDQEAWRGVRDSSGRGAAKLCLHKLQKEGDA